MPNTQLGIDGVEQLAESLGQLPEPAANPVLIIISGLPGTGKSHFARRLAEKLPLVILESDALRKVLYPSPTYNSGESADLFGAIHQLIKQLLGRGISLILDATNLSERNRQILHTIADAAGARTVLLSVEAPPEAVRRRLSSRRRDSGNNSDAGWSIYQKMKESAERIRRRHYVVDTSGDISPVIDKIVREVTG